MIFSTATTKNIDHQTDIGPFNFNHNNKEELLLMTSWPNLLSNGKIAVVNRHA